MTVTAPASTPSALLDAYMQFVQALHSLNQHQRDELWDRWQQYAGNDVVVLADQAEQVAYDSGRISADHHVVGLASFLEGDIEPLFTTDFRAGAAPALALITRDLIGEEAYRKLTDWMLPSDEPVYPVYPEVPVRQEAALQTAAPRPGPPWWHRWLALACGVAVPVTVFLAGKVTQTVGPAGLLILLASPVLAILAAVFGRPRRM